MSDDIGDFPPRFAVRRPAAIAEPNDTIPDASLQAALGEIARLTAENEALRAGVAEALEAAARLVEDEPDHGISKQTLWRLAARIRRSIPSAGGVRRIQPQQAEVTEAMVKKARKVRVNVPGAVDLSGLGQSLPDSVIRAVLTAALSAQQEEPK